MTPDELQKYSTALVAPAIAFFSAMTGSFAVFIAYRQWRLGKDNWRLNLYAKRFETYKHVMKFIATGGNCDNETRYQFLRDAESHEFLFEKDIAEYIRRLYEKSLGRSNLERDLQNMHGPVYDDHRKHLGEQALVIAYWFPKQFDVTRKLFGAYLTITER